MHLYPSTKRIVAGLVVSVAALALLAPVGVNAVPLGDGNPKVIAYLEALAASQIAETRDAPVTPADTIHPNIHQNNGPGQNANPNGANDGGGNIHGIGNVPGQNDDSVPGVCNLNNVHGGIAEVNPQAAACP